MIDRHWFGDLALAVVLVLPFGALARPVPDLHRHAATSAAANAVTAGRLPGNGRISLLG